MQKEELGPDGFIVRDAVPASDVIRIRFADVDGLRAVAIISVCFAIFARTLLHGTVPMIDRVANEATQGLTLFLVLSGFTLAFPAMAVLRQDGRTYLDVGRFVIRRLVRIYPTYVVALALTAVIGTLATGSIAKALGNPTLGGVVANLFFLGNGFGNDGFRAIELFLRAYLFFPALVLLWTRRPLLFAGLGVALAVLDVATPAHAWTIAAFVPFMLGIVAADMRAQVHRLERFAPILLVLAVALAIISGPTIAGLRGAAFAPGALRVDPFWALAAFALVISVGAFRPLERLFGFWAMRVLGAASYSVSLVVIPTCSLAALSRYGSGFAVPAIFMVGFSVWQLVDRWFSDEQFRRTTASVAAGPIDALLKLTGADRVFLGAPLEPALTTDPLPAHEEAFVPTYYAPPTRTRAADLAVVSRRTGSPEELAAEIVETKARLQERSAAIFADPTPAPMPTTYAKPGFYRKSVPPSGSATARAVVTMPGGSLTPTTMHASPLPPPTALTAEQHRTPANGQPKAIRIRIVPGDGAQHG